MSDTNCAKTPTPYSELMVGHVRTANSIRLAIFRFSPTYPLAIVVFLAI